MAAQASTDDPVAWCRSRLLVPGHPLSITLPYAPPERRDEIVALSSVISEIASVPGDVSDPEVARRKLGWWRQALAEKMPHPSVQAWLQSGAAASVGAEAFDPLIDAVAAEIEPPRFEQVGELDRHCREIAGPGALLEAQLINAGAVPDEAESALLVALAGAGYRIRVARDLMLDARRNRWLVPLELQAEYQLTRQHVAAGEGGIRLRALVRHMAGDALLAFDDAWRRLPAGRAWRHRHALLRGYLDRRVGQALVRRPARALGERVATGGIADAFAVWRAARRLRRGAAADANR